MHGIHDRFESQTQRGDLIFHFRRYFRIDRPYQQTTFLHLPQLVREDFLRNARNGPLKVREPLHPWKRYPKSTIFHRPPMRSAVNSAGQSRCFAMEEFRFTRRYPFGA